MNKNIFNEIKKIHLIGIGGIGMSGIAEYLAGKGYQVSGSDMYMTENTERLKNFGIKIIHGHSEENINPDTGLVIYTSAVKDDNPEFQKAKKMNLPLYKRAEALGAIVNDKFVISISGTHGKTTTTAMTAKVLIDNNYDPVVFAGGNMEFLNDGSSRIGEGNYAVVEADEYDRSFHHLRSDIAVILNIETDHLDIYNDLDDIKNSFRIFLENSKQNAYLIGNGDDENVRSVTSTMKNKSFFGTGDENEFQIKDINFTQDGMNFKISDDEFNLKVLGDHNAMDAAAAFIISKKLNIESEDFKKSISTFKEVKRRLELKYNGEFKIYDDYSHHPTEVRKTLETMNKIKQGRIITVFQPHLFTRTRDFYKDFADAFGSTDILILEKIYPAREEEIAGISSKLILDEFLKNGYEGYYHEDQNEIYKNLKKIIGKDDIVIFMGAGTVTEHCSEFIDQLNRSSDEL
jgi:UDP-N-acetylmuramate--alanine ligase